MRSFYSISICFSLALMVAGCSVGAPGPMPRGFSSYNKEFKSAPGADARNVGYEYSHEKNDMVLKDMRYAARDLVERLDQKLSFSVDEIYLKTPANTAFYNSFDHLLRDELTQRGYLLVNVPGDSVDIEFVAKKVNAPCMQSDKNSDYQNTYLALAIGVKRDIPLDVIGGFYEVPVYDYRNAGHIEINVPTCSLQVPSEDK